MAYAGFDSHRVETENNLESTITYFACALLPKLFAFLRSFPVTDCFLHSSALDRGLVESWLSPPAALSKP